MGECTDMYFMKHNIDKVLLASSAKRQNKATSKWDGGKYGSVGR
jgi:hypothetical protein